MRKRQIVIDYFNEIAGKFDEIYIGGNSFIDKIINKIFRKGMRERVALTVKSCGRNNTILDVGCGSGRVAILLSNKGNKVTGIDCSLEMIKLAGANKINYEKENNKIDVNFYYSDIMEESDNNNKYDIVIALGVLDYIDDPTSFMRKIVNCANKKVIVTFPDKFTMQTPLRKLWLLIKRCPVYFYTFKQLKDIIASLGINDYEIIKMSSGYWVEIRI